MRGHFDLVRGGTTTGAYDQQLARERLDTERRRATYDAREEMARKVQGANFYKTASLGSLKENAVIVLTIPRRDKSVLSWMACELSAEGDGELVLIVACPNCFFRLGRPLGECQLTIRKSHRPFTLDTRTKEEGGSRGEIWVNPTDVNDTYELAGEVTSHGNMRCDHLGCNYRFVIDKNVIREA